MFQSFEIICISSGTCMTVLHILFYISEKKLELICLYELWCHQLHGSGLAGWGTAVLYMIGRNMYFYLPSLIYVLRYSKNSLVTYLTIGISQYKKKMTFPEMTNFENFFFSTFFECLV